MRIDPIVYLSSTKYHWWNFRSKNWKNRLIEEFKKSKLSNVNYIDPLQYESMDPSVVEMDMNDIRKCDYVVCYIDKITIGTMLELDIVYTITIFRNENSI